MFLSRCLGNESCVHGVHEVVLALDSLRARASCHERRSSNRRAVIPDGSSTDRTGRRHAGLRGKRITSTQNLRVAESPLPQKLPPELRTPNPEREPEREHEPGTWNPEHGTAVYCVATTFFNES
jgi:hypothetical protein